MRIQIFRPRCPRGCVSSKTIGIDGTQRMLLLFGVVAQAKAKARAKKSKLTRKIAGFLNNRMR